MYVVSAVRWGWGDRMRRSFDFHLLLAAQQVVEENAYALASEDRLEDLARL